MKEINKNHPPLDDELEELERNGETSSTKDSDGDIDDPLEVVIEEEQDEKEKEDTQDDLFDDDELDLDPTLDREEW